MMDTSELLKQYNDWKFKVSAYEMAVSLIGIEEQTIAPSGGSEYRNDRMAFLQGELFSLSTSEDALKMVDAVKNNEAIDEVTRREARLFSRSMHNFCCIPKDTYVEFTKLQADNYLRWKKAKEAGDYSLFEDSLVAIIEMERKIYGFRGSDVPLYDQMLDEFEPGMNMAFYDRFFDQVKERLVPLIQRVAKAEPIDDSFLYLDYPIDRQREYTEKYLLPYLGYTSDWGYVGETEHPFTAWTCENDCRVTTKYLENSAVSNIFSIIHETGHAWYEHDIDPRFDGGPLSNNVGSAMHESQSRFCENYLGRSASFWKYCYKDLQKEFPQQLGGVDVDTFVRAINASRPSLIRTEADELTYPLHILIRYEIEKGLFTGKISTANLNKTWNDMYEKYLGVRPANDREGILQDVHWADGSFGYFPTYALGSAFGAQFLHAMKKDIDVDAALAEGRYLDCIGWLKEHIHRYGALYDAGTMVKMASGEPFDARYYLDYLEDKYSRLYSLGD
ncbi:carboxypeptidase M32 [Galactobacillus timonensis]|uniref:carboxypeptidase M32 n=1 Tax=Galactobacillus timonensis TaxID=2041840 RepID=UPI0024095243|nr:carboxypeptidase M32 [Galactobacillus timonensis]MDD6370337.1 carboxypeptidase M32 [Galactobacillus timonensis]